MGRSTIRERPVMALATGLLFLSLWMPTAQADGGPGRPNVDAHEPHTSFEAHVQSQPDGVDVRITARQTIPGDQAPVAAPPPAAPSQSAPTAPAPAAQPAD